MPAAPSARSSPIATRLPPGSRLPALAQTLWLVGRPRGYFSSMRARHGDTFTTSMLHGSVVVGCTPAHAKQLFSADPAIFRVFLGESIRGILGGDALPVACGDAHKRARKLLQPPFHGARMRAYGRAMQEVTRAHFGALKRGEQLRMHDVTTAISLDIILRSVFGIDGTQFAEGRSTLQDLLACISPLVLFSPRLQHPLFPPWRRLLAARAAYQRLVGRLIRDRRASGQPGEDILGMLLQASWDDGQTMSDGEICDQLLTILVAGHETTAISLAWAIHDVYRRPQVLQRLRDELDPLGSDPDPEALIKLPYLSAVCDESLRFRPVLPDTMRTVTAPFEYGGYTLPPGVGVCIAIELIHCDPSIYPDPDAFLPERFLDKKPSPFEFLPFGGGHRRCLGAAFADHEARITLGTIVKGFDLTPLVEDQRQRRNLTMGPRLGVPTRITGRR